MKIYEKALQGRSQSDFFALSKIAKITKNKSRIYFNHVAEEQLQLKNGSEILMAKEGKRHFIAILNPTSELTGYKVRRQSGKSGNYLAIQSPAFVTRVEIGLGVHTISGFAKYDSATKLDWYEIISE